MRNNLKADLEIFTTLHGLENFKALHEGAALAELEVHIEASTRHLAHSGLKNRPLFVSLGFFVLGGLLVWATSEVSAGWKFLTGPSAAFSLGLGSLCLLFALGFYPDSAPPPSTRIRWLVRLVTGASGRATPATRSGQGEQPVRRSDSG
jgi:hypothetical protein